ncbi:AMP-binding protein [Nocardia vinacea]|uniref:class I adenylate-forming enzyme family protein n=1 Tax=Nocardia vinacea TaxID=96468 RepID=UPI00340A8F52
MGSNDSRRGAAPAATVRAEPVALAFEDRGYTYGQLDRLAGGLAVELVARGVRAGHRVALMSTNRPEFVVAVLATWLLGATPLLISPAWKRAEVEHALALTEPAHGLGDAPILAELLPTRHLDDPITPLTHTFGRPDPESDAVLVFSSGTTGLPKAVRHTHASLAAAVGHWTRVLELNSYDRLQIVTPPSHILGLLNIVTVLEAGTWMRLHRRFDLERMLHCIAEDRITIEMAVAPIALALAAHPELESYDLSSLRYIMWGATPVTAAVAETVTARTGVGWLPAYGTTELPVIACSPIGDVRYDSVGKAAPGVQLRVVSTTTGEPLGPGEIGEIQARSTSLMAGYLPAEATGQAFDDGWYRTGDIGRIDADGWVQVTDQSKEMIKVRGFQVAPAEIEAVLHGHPAVGDCAVFGIADPADGEAIVAAVARAAAVTDDELIALVGDRLAGYKRPRRVVFVPEIPRLPSGKVLRRILKEQYGRSSHE